MTKTVFEKIVERGLIDINISTAKEVEIDSTAFVRPIDLINRFDVSRKALDTVYYAREDVKKILLGEDQRKLLVVGPCSVHNPAAFIEYAGQIKEMAEKVKDQFLVVLRAYLEKPRTLLNGENWTGYVYDPNMDGSHDMRKGLRLSRQLFIEINEIGIPVATEFLDPPIAQRLGDMVAYVAIGARNSGAQFYRKMASGVSMPVGVKNDLYGNIDEALQTIASMKYPQAFIGEDYYGRTGLLPTRGNAYGHLILRGAKAGPNYAEVNVDKVIKATKEQDRPAQSLLIDCSHGNSNKDYNRQVEVFDDVIKQMCQERQKVKQSEGSACCRIGLMVESYIKPGKQKLVIGKTDVTALDCEMSVTDGCLGLAETCEMVYRGAERLRSASYTVNTK